MKTIVGLACMILSVFLFVVVIQSCASRKAEAIKGKQFVPANARVANGERMYMMHCDKCHPGGEAGLGPAINSNPAPQFIKRFQMRHGLGVMPAFKKNEISKKDLRDISKFLRAWKHY
ncbi:MAG TPA: cytochrome c [Chitinophagaceae bacterium]|nr:cytochrome c [Chitinophagaceae bacterium]